MIDVLKSICGGKNKIWAGKYNGTPVQIYPVTGVLNTTFYKRVTYTSGTTAALYTKSEMLTLVNSNPNITAFILKINGTVVITSASNATFSFGFGYNSSNGVELYKGSKIPNGTYTLSCTLPLIAGSNYTRSTGQTSLSSTYDYLLPMHTHILYASVFYNDSTVLYFSSSGATYSLNIYCDIYYITL